MTDPQLEALALLAITHRPTTKYTALGCIGGRTAACLVKRGYARRRPDNEVEITDAGRAAYAEAMA